MKDNSPFGESAHTEYTKRVLLSRARREQDRLALDEAYSGRSQPTPSMSSAKRLAVLRSAPDDGVTRDEIYQRDHGVCWHCLGHVPPEDFHLDHLVPVSSPAFLGHVRYNVVVSHSRCNLIKHARYGPEEFAAAELLRGWYELTGA